MGNPVITRLGRSQIWYQKWYTDSKYSTNIKLSKSFNDIVKGYFNYGLFFTNNFFVNVFWYRNTPYDQTKSPQTSLYFRRYFYAHDKLTIEHTYLIRNCTPEYFPLRLYILKYSNWLILSLQWFKPVKHKRGTVTTATTKNGTNKLIYKSTGNKKTKTTVNIRLKTSIYNLLKLLRTTKTKYVF